MTRLPLAIAVDHPAFAGHFPGRPILPGVVLLDESLRAVVRHAHRESPAAGRWHVAQAKFLSFVVPGDAVHLELDPAAGADRFRLRVLAGHDANERVAMTGSIAFVVDADPTGVQA